jgi:hypothetical protein
MIGITQRMPHNDVRDEDILRFVDADEALDPALVDHIRACATCSAEAARIAAQQTQLRQVLYRFDCPSAQGLGEYALELVSTEQRVSIASHVLQCTDCQAELSTLRTFLATDAQPAVGLGEHLRRILATLVGPGEARLAHAGARRSISGHGPLTYRAESLLVSLSTARDGRSVAGLVLWEGEDTDEPALEGGAVRLIRDGDRVAEATVDALGNFALPVPPSTDAFAIELHLADRIVVLEDVRLNA